MSKKKGQRSSRKQVADRAAKVKRKKDKRGGPLPLPKRGLSTEELLRINEEGI